jgi:hypothetical protein
LVPKARIIAAQFHLREDGTYELFSLWHFQQHERGHWYYHCYDVDWCKRDQSYVFHQSGGGPTPIEIDGLYWASEGAPITERPCQLVDDDARERNATRRLPEVPIDIEGCADVLDWLENTAQDEGTEYCSVCDDRLPTDDLCEHIWWCEETAWYSTPDERRLDCACEECTSRLAEAQDA